MKCFFLTLFLMGSSISCAGGGSSSPPLLTVITPVQASPQLPVLLDCINYAGNYMSHSFFATITQPSCNQVEIKYFDSSSSGKLLSHHIFSRVGLVKNTSTSDSSFEETTSHQILNDRLVFMNVSHYYFPKGDQLSSIRETLTKNPDGSITAESLITSSPGYRVRLINTIWTQI